MYGCPHSKENEVEMRELNYHDFIGCAELSMEIGDYDGMRVYLEYVSYKDLLIIVAKSPAEGPNEMEASAYMRLVSEGFNPRYISDFVVGYLDAEAKGADFDPDEPYETESAWNALNKNYL